MTAQLSIGRSRGPHGDTEVVIACQFAQSDERSVPRHYMIPRRRLLRSSSLLLGSVATGVVFTTLWHALKPDYVAAVSLACSECLIVAVAVGWLGARADWRWFIALAPAVLNTTSEFTSLVLSAAEGGARMFTIGDVGALTLVSAVQTGVAYVVRRNLVARDAPDGASRCPECGYDLTGNTSGRCPECGTVVTRK